jgi:hypothetical protein
MFILPASTIGWCLNKVGQPQIVKIEMKPKQHKYIKGDNLQPMK